MGPPGAPPIGPRIPRIATLSPVSLNGPPSMERVPGEFKSIKVDNSAAALARGTSKFQTSFGVPLAKTAALLPSLLQNFQIVMFLLPRLRQNYYVKSWEH